MFEKLKNLRVNVTGGAVLCIILGIFCIVNPGGFVMTITKIIGVIFIIAGIAAFLVGIIGEDKNLIEIILGVVLIIVGAFILKHQYAAASFFPVLAGIILIVSAIEDFSMTSAGRIAAAPFWQVILISGIVKLVLGIFSLITPFTVAAVSTAVLGIFLLLDGISSVFLVAKVDKAEGVFDSTITSEKNL